ncbi:MAG: YifB family Mg chelatase-like AAA ATPase [Armatimonadetes bacterium]|nr:YifB family Mg chelatase-like AAA ATPase [Armatimonadota bacterium]
MLAQVFSAGVLGVDAYLVEVEVDVIRTSGDQVRFSVVGLPDTAVQESRERVRSAIKNSGYTFPMCRLTVNLAPADVRKEGPAFDLPIALGVLAGTGQLKAPRLADYLVAGELGLDGEVRPISGVLPIAIGARDAGRRALIVPEVNAREAAVVHRLEVYPVATLQEAASVLAETGERAPLAEEAGIDLQMPRYEIDFSDVKGQEHAKRALEVAAAGAHNILLLGPPGSGKTMLARRVGTILPPLAFEEALEVTKIYSISGLLPPHSSLVTTRPFRSPHHTVSDAGLIGGGSIPRPGEVSLAHHGVLFLDELPEFKREALEVLRQPLEDGVVTISRAAAALTYPARCMLVTAANPCPCGFLGDTVKPCTCSAAQIQRYHMRVSGPLLDRIDIHLEVPRLKEEDLLRPPAGERSATVRERVSAARRRQQARFAGTGISCNAAMEAKHLRQYCALAADAQQLLRTAIHQLGLSARAHDRIVKLARTIADLAGTEEIAVGHVAEAIQYRSLDRKVWG